MHEQNLISNAVAAIRVSTTKQGTDGDSPDDQLRQIEQYASGSNAKVVKQFTFMESASKEQQPMQEAIDYCKDPKNKVNLFIVKSIDRFTRAGSYSYDMLKNQLDDCGVILVDIYGVISNQKINTLEHLGVKYKWSEYSPTKKAEMLEAERAKDEIRDIQTRMIGAQIRYVRMGYWVRRPLLGFNNVHIETREGKRCILEPNDKEAPWIKKIFELRAAGTMEDIQIVDFMNVMGFQTRERIVRDKHDRTKAVRVIGGVPLSLKELWRIVENPVYAGVNPERWTQDKPVRCQFDGLVSIELFNTANRGKITITELDQGVQIHRREAPVYLIKKGVKNNEFPYKRIVMCPECSKPLYGSASRGRHGGYFPAYHCDHRGHYFRVTKKQFDETIVRFVSSISLSQQYIDALLALVGEAYDKKLLDAYKDVSTIETRISELQAQVSIDVDKIKLLSSEATIKYMEEDIMRLEKEIGDLRVKVEQIKVQEPVDMDKIKAYVRYYLEHLEELILHHCNPVLKARYFGLIFDVAPSYADIVSGTPDISKIKGVNEIFSSAKLFDETYGWG